MSWRGAPGEISPREPANHATPPAKNNKNLLIIDKLSTEIVKINKKNIRESLKPIGLLNFKFLTNND